MVCAYSDNAKSARPILETGGQSESLFGYIDASWGTKGHKFHGLIARLGQVLHDAGVPGDEN